MGRGKKQNDADSGTNNRKCEMSNELATGTWKLELPCYSLSATADTAARAVEIRQRRKRRCVYGVAERKRGANDYGFKCVRNDQQHVGFEL